MSHRENTIGRITTDEAQFVNSQLIEFNASQVPFTQKEPFVNVGLALRNEDGRVIGGILAVVYCWQCLYINALWIGEEYRGLGYGAELLSKVEGEAIKVGCTLSHLDTFDFQANGFYIRQGYEIFGTLDDCPPGHKRFFLKKTLSPESLDSGDTH